MVSVELDESRVLIIAKLGIEGYSILARLASNCESVIWVSSNPNIPSKITQAYSLKAKILGFYSESNQVISPLSLNEISSIVRHLGAEKACVIISCLSELLMYHNVNRVYYFLLNMMKTTKKLFGMLIDGAQSRRDEMLISTLFDAVFRLEKKMINDKFEIVLVPEVYTKNTVYRLRYNNTIKLKFIT